MKLQVFILTFAPILQHTNSVNKPSYRIKKPREFLQHNKTKSKCKATSNL